MKNIDEQIKEYCGSLEDRFGACTDIMVAQLLKERVCWEFEQADLNGICLNDVKLYLEKLINEKFSDNA